MTTVWQLHIRKLGRLLLAMAVGMGLLMAASAAQAAPPTQAPPTLDVTGLSEVTPGQPSTATVTFTDNGAKSLRHVQLSLSAPAGWTVTATSATSFKAVKSGQTVQATFQVVAPEFQSADVTATGQWGGGKYPESISVTTTVVTSPPTTTTTTPPPTTTTTTPPPTTTTTTPPPTTTTTTPPPTTTTTTPPPTDSKSYEAEAATNTIAGGAIVSDCSICSGGKDVTSVGWGGTVTFNDVTAPSAGNYTVTIDYVERAPSQATVSVNGGTPQMLSFTTPMPNLVNTMDVSLALAAGNNTIQFDRPSDSGDGWAPDFDRILVAATPS